MADTNNNPVAAGSGGPSVSSTGPNAAQGAPDSQKGDAANATGQTEAPAGLKVPDENHASGPEGVPSDG